MAHPKPKRPTGGAVLPPPDPVNRAFVARRELIVRQSVRDPVVRVASFLLYLSNNNVQQGGRATMIGDDLRCGTVAWMLGMTVDALESHLMFLRTLGLIQAAPSGALEVIDFAGLERISDMGMSG